jgi:hypothetical protein
MKIETSIWYAHLDRVVGRADDRGLLLVDSSIVVPFEAPLGSSDEEICRIIHDEVLPQYPNWDCNRYTINEDGEL